MGKDDLEAGIVGVAGWAGTGVAASATPVSVAGTGMAETSRCK